MRTPTGLVAHSLLGGLTLLSAGAIVLSLVTAPPVAQEQLRLAAKATSAAGSFVLTDMNRISTPAPSAALGGKSSATSTVRIVYQSPDRILDRVSESSGQTVTLLLVGDRAFEKVGNAAWSQVPPGSLTSTGADAARSVLRPLGSLSSATSVVLSGQTYRFVSGNQLSLLEDLLGAQATGQLSSVHFSAQLSGEFVGSETLVVDEGTFRDSIHFVYSSVDHAPPVEVPASS
ncbi:MAG: hypothetical protein ACRDV4_05190 [Acidimicrobiales bacterium]